MLALTSTQKHNLFGLSKNAQMQCAPACRRHGNFYQTANKKPSPQEKDWVFSTPPFTAFHRRPVVKRIQAGFLAYGSSYRLPLPILCPFDMRSTEPVEVSGLRPVDLASFVPDYSGVAVPDSHEVPLSVLSHLNPDIFSFSIPQLLSECQMINKLRNQSSEKSARKLHGVLA
jgi:hypothetical protein